MYNICCLKFLNIIFEQLANGTETALRNPGHIDMNLWRGWVPFFVNSFAAADIDSLLIVSVYRGLTTVNATARSQTMTWSTTAIPLQYHTSIL